MQQSFNNFVVERNLMKILQLHLKLRRNFCAITRTSSNALEPWIHLSRQHFVQHKNLESYMCKLICLIYISLNFQKVRVENVEKILLTESPETFEHCVVWALDKYNEWFCNDIIQILFRS